MTNLFIHTMISAYIVLSFINLTIVLVRIIMFFTTNYLNENFFDYVIWDRDYDNSIVIANTFSFLTYNGVALFTVIVVFVSKLF